MTKKYISNFILYGLTINVFIFILYKINFVQEYLIYFLSFIPMMILEESDLIGNKFLNDGEFFVIAFISSSITIILLAAVFGGVYGFIKSKQLNKYD